MDLITRKDARALGVRYYFTGIPCLRGHIVPRPVKSMICPVCDAHNAKMRYRNKTVADREKALAAMKAYRLRDLERAKSKQRGSYNRHREKRIEARIGKVYGLPPGGYQRLLDIQGGVCAICKKGEVLRDKKTGRVRRLAVDHDHVTNVTRGLLCAACNTAIGHFDDDRELLKAAIAYLDAHGQTKLKLVDECYVK